MTDAPQMGGPKVVQQHVRILNQHGFDARIVLGGRRGGWLSRLTSRHPEYVVTRSEFEKTVSPQDFVVLPAVRADESQRLPGEKKVLFVQNGALLFNSMKLDATGTYPWHSAGLRAIICVSDYDKCLLELLSPACPVYRAINSVKLDDFPFVPWERKENLVLTAPLLPYKNPWHTATVCHLLLSRSDAGVGIVPRPEVKAVQRIPAAEVPTLLGRAKILLFLSTSEGFGLLPAEAMMSGTVVVCYRGQAYQEFVPEECMHAVGDFDAIVKTIEQLLRGELAGEWRETIARGRARAERYSTAAQQNSVLDIWTTITAS